MNRFLKIKDFILKDVKNENEMKKTSVSLRINAIIMAIYFACLILVFLLERESSLVISSVVCLLAYCLSFHLTYINHTRMALWFAEILSVAWIITFVYQMGWNCGVQHYIFALLVLLFTPEFLSVNAKILHGVVLCFLRLCLYMYSNNFEAVHAISSDMSVVFQILNTFFVFFNILVMLVVFTYDSARMQEKLVKYNVKLHKMASEDPLTGLINRRAMMDKINQVIRDNPESIGPCIAIGDLDFFKKINDTYGHEAGDEVLKIAATLFKNFMEKNGLVGRWGGEEFLFVFTDCNLDEANSKLVDLLGMVRRVAVPYEDREIHFTMTIGVEEYGGGDVEKVINLADEKLYMGKESGRDRVIC